MIPTKKTKTIDQWIALVHQQKVSTITPAIFIVSFLTILGLLGLCFQIGTPYSQVLFEVGVVFQLGFVILNLKKHQELFAPIEDLSQGLESYAQCYAHIHNCEYHCEYLRYLKNKMCIEGKAVEGILELSKLAQRVIYRHNIFAFLFLNGLGLFDFYLRNQYAKWLNEYGQLVACWFDGLAEIEALMSLSVLKIDDFKAVSYTHLSEAFEPELVFTLQEKSIDSIPDATITQEGFKIVVETKLTDWFYSKQLMNHLKSFGDEKHKIMITLSSELMNDDKKKYFEEQLKNYNETQKYPVIHINTTFECLARCV